MVVAVVVVWGDGGLGGTMDVVGGLELWLLTLAGQQQAEERAEDFALSLCAYGLKPLPKTPATSSVAEGQRAALVF